MSVKYGILAVLVVFAVSLLVSVCEAVGTRAIDRVRGKSVLDEGDFQVIEDVIIAKDVLAKADRHRSWRV